MPFGELSEAREGVKFKPVVGLKNTEVATAGELDSLVHAVAVAGVGFVEEAEAGVDGLVGFDDGEGVIGGAVVDTEDFEVAEGLVGEGVEGLAEVGGGVVDRDKDGGEGGGGGFSLGGELTHLVYYNIRRLGVEMVKLKTMVGGEEGVALGEEVGDYRDAWLDFKQDALWGVLGKFFFDGTCYCGRKLSVPILNDEEAIGWSNIVSEIKTFERGTVAISCYRLADWDVFWRFFPVLCQ